MIRRRVQVCVACILLLACANTLASARQSWDFKVFLDDKAIGQHYFNVYTDGNVRYVSTQAKFNVRVLFFNAYHYYHEDNEVWQGQCLKSIRSITNDNGDLEKVTGNRLNDVLHLQTQNSKKTFPGCIQTFAYWDPVILKSKYLLNSQNGELLDVKVTSLGKQKIQVRGQQVIASHYRLVTAKFTIDLWYSEDWQWLALQSTTSSGKTLHYRLR